MNTNTCRHRNGGERGQVTIVMLGVIAIALILAVALALVGQAMVHRARARTAADAIALARTAAPEIEQQLVQWYASQGVVAERRNDGVWASSGPSQAAAWAGTSADQVQTEPVLRAIVARVEQLRGHQFASVTWQRSSFELDEADAQIMQSMSAEFLLCETSSGTASAGASSTRYRFERC